MPPVTLPRWATPRRAIVAGLIAAALALCAAITFSLLPGRAATTVAAPTTAVTTEPIPLSTTGPTDPDSTQAPGAPSEPSEPGTTRTSTEVQGSGASTARTNPAPTPITPLLSGAAPKTASAIGSLVSGFPETIPVASTSTIANSAIASSGENVQVTLVAKTTRAAADVLAFYQATFSKIGLPETEIPAVGGSTAFSFAHGNDTVTLTVTATKNGANYSIYGVLRATP